MAEKYLEYHLENGYVRSWLVAGPLARPAQGGDTPEERQKLVLAMQDPTPGYNAEPVDWTEFSYADQSLRWRYYRCGIDNLVDVSEVYPSRVYLRTWAHARLVMPAAGRAQAVLSVSGPVTVWVNGRQVFSSEPFSADLKPLSLDLDQESDVLVRFDHLCARACRAQMAFRLTSLPEGVRPEDVIVRLGTKARYPYRHQQFESMLEKAYMEEVANFQGHVVNLRWADDTTEELRYGYQLQDKNENIYIDGSWDIELDKPFDVGHPQRIFERPLWLVLRAPAREYYEQDNRYERRMPFYVLDNEYSQQPYGDYGSRRIEALQDASRRDGSLYAEIAKMALGQWDRLDMKVLQAAFEPARLREAGGASVNAGLLIIAYRFMETSEFPKKLREPLETALMSFRYSADEPGSSAEDYTSESQVILLAACELLAGQRYPKRTFTGSGITGRQHQERAEKIALEWLAKRGRGGFMQWNANSAFEVNVAALALLTSLAKNEAVVELSAVLLDKILFLMAVNSFEGSFGVTHGASSPWMIKSARLEATSAINCMLWGMGVYSRYIMGTVSLACSDYEFPVFFGDMAAYPPDELWSKECQVADPDAPASAEVNTVLYKTPDGMLSSAQDYRPGQPGSGEHIWQATLGPDAVVFSNHPACVGDSDAHQPGFWLGNAVLPRVAQWKNSLVAVYQLPQDDRMGFTHAFFPIYQFDEYEVSGGWAFARKGQGFVAITAMQDLELVKHGPDGYRELRSYGPNNIWVCHVGRQAVDGDFASFKSKVLENAPVWENLSTRFTNLRGETISFGWDEPLRVNGEEQPLSGFKHIDNLYCQAEMPANQIEITYEDLVMRLNFQ